jgi:hypothetical protein
MNWAWASTLDQLWRSPAFPMWLTLAAAGFFAVIVLITLLRAEKSVANGALTVITLLAVGIALAATIRGFGLSGTGTAEDSVPSTTAAGMPALACVDDLAGENVLTACEKALFGSPEAAAAALSYAARQVTRLTTFSDVAAADKRTTPDLEALRRAVEHDRYGLMAEVLVARDHCTPSDCAAFRFLIDRSRIVANIEEKTYDAMIARYSPLWNAPPTAAPAVAAVAPLIPGVPTGRPTNAEFPSASSTPPVSIMTAEPTTASAPRQPAPAAATPSPKPPAPAAPAVAAAKKPPAAPKAAARTPPPAPATSLAPTAAPAAASSD